LGKSTGKQESHGFDRKLSVKWINRESRRMPTMKNKGELQKTEERIEKGHRQGQEGISPEHT
jgi:hypothetical protein